MKPVLIFLVFAIFNCRSQESVTKHFQFSEERLSAVLSSIEEKFDVKYSYADSIVDSYLITIHSSEYTISQINSEITKQTSLLVAKIDEQYYSVYQNPELPISSVSVAEVVVDAFLSKGIRKSNEKFIISPQKIEELPGVTDADVLLSLQQLPGVKSPNETASGLHIRGGTPDQNLIMWDGIRMYHPGHLFGMISGFNPNVEQTVHYYNKATSPRFGGRISGVIDIKPTDKISEDFSIDAGLNLLNADVYAKIPVVNDKIGLQLSARKSITEWFQSPAFNSLQEKVFQNTDFDDFDNENRFGFQDYSAKLNFNPGKNTQFSLTGIMIDNALYFDSVNSENQNQNQQMNVLNHGYSFNWKQQYSKSFKQELLLYYSAYTFDYQKTRASDNGSDSFVKRNRIIDSGMEINFDYVFSKMFSTEFGYQLFGNDVSHSFTNQTENFEIDLDSRHLYNITHSGFGYLKYAANGWNLQTGGRFNSFTGLDNETWEPRVFVSKTIGNFTIQSSYELKSQVMSQIRESAVSDMSLENYIWILSDNDDYPLQKASQFTTGLIFKKSSWVIDADAYYKKIRGVTSLTFGFLHQFDSEVHQGNGFTKGFDLLIQKSRPSWRAWITYTYQNSRNRYDGINDGEFFAINGDITHSVTTSFYKKWNRLSMSLGWFWHTGKPYSVLTSDNEIISLNNKRLPTYHRLDLSATYQFYERKSWSGKVGISILNLYNRRTILSKEYERQYSTIEDVVNSNYAVQDYRSLGFTPNIFVRVSI